MKKTIFGILCVAAVDAAIACIVAYLRGFTLSTFQGSLMIVGLITMLLTAVIGMGPNSSKMNTESYYLTNMKGIEGYNRPLPNVTLVAGGAIAFAISLLMNAVL